MLRVGDSVSIGLGDDGLGDDGSWNRLPCKELAEDVNVAGVDGDLVP